MTTKRVSVRDLEVVITAWTLLSEMVCFASGFVWMQLQAVLQHLRSAPTAVVVGVVLFTALLVGLFAWNRRRIDAPAMAAPSVDDNKDISRQLANSSIQLSRAPAVRIRRQRQHWRLRAPNAEAMQIASLTHSNPSRSGISLVACKADRALRSGKIVLNNMCVSFPGMTTAACLPSGCWITSFVAALAGLAFWKTTGQGKICNDQARTMTRFRVCPRVVFVPQDNIMIHTLAVRQVLKTRMRLPSMMSDAAKLCVVDAVMHVLGVIK
jgi:hypothetical protein